MQQDNNNNNIQKKSNELWFVFIALILVYLVISFLMNLLASKNIFLPTELLLIISELSLILPVLFLYIKNRYSLRNDLGFRKIKVGTIFMTILLGFCVMPIASFVNVLTQFFVSNTMTQASDQLTDGSQLLILFITGFFAPFIEEVVFRATFHNTFKGLTTPLKAILVSALMFGLMHLNVNQACYAVVLGIIFAIVNVASGSVYTSMIIHTVINTFNMLILMVTNALFKANDINLADAVEETRTTNTNLMFVTAGVYFVLAIIFGIVSILIITFIAKHENHFDDLKSIFIKSNDATDDSVIQARVFKSIPALIAIVLCLFIIFGLDYVTSAMGF